MPPTFCWSTPTSMMARFDDSLIHISLIGTQCQSHLLYAPLYITRMGFHSKLLSLPRTVVSFCRSLKSNVTITQSLRHSRNSRKPNPNCQSMSRTSCPVLGLDMIESTSSPGAVESAPSQKTLLVVNVTSEVYCDSEMDDSPSLADERKTSILLELASSVVKQLSRFLIYHLANVTSFNSKVSVAKLPATLQFRRTRIRCRSISATSLIPRHLSPAVLPPNSGSGLSDHRHHILMLAS